MTQPNTTAATTPDVNVDLLERLTQTPGVAGREHQVRTLIQREIAGLFDHTTIDALGSLIAVRKPRPAPGSSNGAAAAKKPYKVMLAAHMDQIGFMVRHIDDQGFIRINAVGGFDTRNLLARTVTITTDTGELVGVLNPTGRPIHIAEESEKKKVPEIKDFFIDLGLPADQVKERVKIGDMVTLRAPFERVGNTLVAQAMDNRVACWLAIESVRQLTHHDCEIYAVFTVQEEIGCRGAGPAAWEIRPDAAISLDITLCVDTPGVPADERVTFAGGGAGLLVMDSSVVSDIELLQEVERIGKSKNIKSQRTILPRGGNDAATIQTKASGHRVLTIVCPTRYVHTVTEMVRTDDLAATRDLLAAYLKVAGNATA